MQHATERPTRLVLALALALTMAGLTTTALRADVVHLKDGGKVEGTVRRDPAGGGWLVVDQAGKFTRVADADVALVEKTSNLTPAQLADAKLSALRRSVEVLDDLGQIIERYERFVEAHRDTAAGAEARKELAVWKDRQAKGMAKIGSTWMTPAEQSRALEQTARLVDKAREQVRAGRYRDAEATVGELLALDRNHPSALYLRGVIAYKQDQLGAAKKAFETVKEALPDHAPTLNNLAVILWKQKQQAAALANYDLAMAAAPRSRLILDNVAEALYAFPERQRNNLSYTRAAKRFQEQDAELQKQLQPQGLFRWGSSYVTAAQMEEIKKAQEKVREKLAALVEDYNKLRDRVQEIDRQIEINERAIERIRRDAMTTGPRDAAGRVLVPSRMPSIYYDLRRENDRLRAEQDDVLAKMETFKEKELRIRQELPVPEFTGSQRLIEVEGTPFVQPPAPPTPPATPAPPAGQAPGRPAEAARPPATAPSSTPAR